MFVLLIFSDELLSIIKRIKQEGNQVRIKACIEDLKEDLEFLKGKINEL